MQKETEPIVGLRKLEAVKGFPDESVDKLSGTEPDVSSEFPNQVGRRTMADIDLECSIVEHMLETNAPTPNARLFTGLLCKTWFSLTRRQPTQKMAEARNPTMNSCKGFACGGFKSGNEADNT